MNRDSLLNYHCCLPVYVLHGAILAINTTMYDIGSWILKNQWKGHKKRTEGARKEPTRYVLVKQKPKAIKDLISFKSAIARNITVVPSIPQQAAW